MSQEELKTAFEKAASENAWGDPDSRSGPGSNLVQTRVIREAIPELIAKYHVKNMLDAPCGDFFWMREIVDKITAIADSYTGADLVDELIEINSRKYAGPKVKFRQLNLIEQQVPRSDLILTRDCFLHLSYQNIYRIVKNFRNSGSVYLLVSTYTRSDRKNQDVDGFFLPGRALNMQKFPFVFGKPLEVINEGCTEGNGAYADKSLGLWELSRIPVSRICFNLFLLEVKQFFSSKSFLHLPSRAWNKFLRIAGIK